MKLKKWLGVFAAAAVACAVLFGAYNALIDPFGVFGDRLMNWYEYDMTKNPRVAKVAWLDKNHENYDSYVLGSSKASSLSVEALNEYMDASFYNMTWYGGDLKDEEQMAEYILANYDVKNIVLTVDPEGAVKYDEEADPVNQRMHCKVDGSSKLLFYGRYLFGNPAYAMEKLKARGQTGYLPTASTVYITETGSYNKLARDAAAIGDMEEYLAGENQVIDMGEPQLEYIDQAAASVAAIRDACAEKGVSFTLIGVPVSDDEFSAYPQEQVAQFWRKLAEVTDFYDFWGPNTVNSDPRYFYDTKHFRNAAGDMALAAIFGNGDIYVPEDFCHLTTAENVETRIAEAFSAAAPDRESYTARAAVLMYHAFTEDASQTGVNTVSAADFQDQLAALSRAGWESVTYAQLESYVKTGAPLPEKCVIISMDDGYQSELDIAAPLLEQYGFQASVAVIGCSVGKSEYKSTGAAIKPHFALESAAEAVKAGTLDIQSHSYDMHQVPELDGADCRRGVLPLEGETEREYIAALTADLLASTGPIETAYGGECFVYTYPYGLCDTLSEAVLHSLGMSVTVTTDEGINTLVKGLPQSLYRLKRINVEGGLSGGELLERLEEYYK